MDQVHADRGFAPGTVVAGRLRVIRLLGTGGMGAVYEVEHEITRHRRALKLLHVQMSQMPGVVERFLREASAAGRIGNPHIVETFDAGRLESGEPYIVMELLQGRTLAEVLSQSGPLDARTAIDVLIQACDATSAAHAAGIVHRDLKPENLFLSGVSADFVKILDFGISKFDASTTGVEGLTLEGSPLGTPYYMSPEQVQGEKSLDGRTDVYALGVVLYECLTGTKPFVADTLPHLVVLIFQGNFIPASTVRTGLPEAFDRIIAKAMARDRNDRFATPAELAQALARLRSTLVPLPLTDASAMDAKDLNRDLRPASTPALTPDVFSRPAWHDPKQRHQRPWRRRPTLTITALVVCIVGTVFVFRAWWAPARRQLGADPTRFSATPLLAPTLAPHAEDAPSDVPPRIVVAPQSSINVTAPSPAISASSAAGPSVTGVGAKRAPSTTPNTPSHTTNRASSFGLTESNPFQ